MCGGDLRAHCGGDGLLDVPGIGQVTLAAMRPYLQPIHVVKTVPHQP